MSVPASVYLRTRRGVHLMRSLTAQVRTFFAALLLTSFAVTPARAIPLSDLITSNGSITVGDKLFDNFSGSLIGEGLFSPQILSGIDVTGGTFGGLPGLLFSGAMTVVAGPGVNEDFSSLDLLLGYDVAALDPTQLISDIHLTFNGDRAGQAATSVTETVFDSAGNVVGQAHVTNPPENLQELIALSVLLPKVSVRKDIALAAFGANGDSQASITFITQAVSQSAVPEPASLLLLGSGLLGAGWVRKR